ncbi:MAG: hydantoinase B/oxoprolinase family protein [Alphaproteobacteria bacterium]
MSLDPITTEVVLSRVRETTDAMAHALFHSGYSPILRESQDGTAGLTDAEGRVITVGGGIQYHSMLYTKSVESLLAAYPGNAMREGDSFICNDPYQAGNSHVPDMVVATPVFYEGTRIAFGVSVAHKADVGGLVPGSSGAAAREIFHDGLRLPPVRYWTTAGVVLEIENIIRTNSRVPDVVVGDLRGQVGATRLGAERMIALADEYGVNTLTGAMASLIERTRDRLKAEIAAWPDGEADAEGFMDHDGADTSKPVRIHVKATKKGDRLMLDFSGSDPQTRGPINTPAQTCKAVTLLATIAASDPTIPVNAGAFEAIDVVLPDGKVVSPVYPATVNHYFPTSHLAYACVLAALGKLNPGRAVAPGGLGNGAIAIGYREGRNGKPTVQYELMTTSLGGTAEHDGTPMVMGMCHFTPSTPVEIVETEYPIRIRKFDIWPDSGGAGKMRGGIGYVREYEMLTNVMLTARTANHEQPGWGLAGGEGPPVCVTAINPDGPEPIELSALDTREAPAGTVVRLSQTGGSGYGDPKDRDPDKVREDVRNGYVSADVARDKYGVEI